MNEQEKKVILSLKNVVVKFNVRGRILTAIRNVSLDIYDGESIAIVGESGSGKSVLTKTFAGMLDSNGFIPEGSVVFSDDDLSKTDVKLTGRNRMTFQYVKGWLDKYSRLERGVAEYQEFLKKKREIQKANELTEEEAAEFAARIKEKDDDIVDRTNYFWTLDKKADAAEYEKTSKQIAELKKEKAAIEDEKKKRIAEKKKQGAQPFAADVNDYDDMVASYDARQAKAAIPDVEPTKENPYGLYRALSLLQADRVPCQTAPGVQTRHVDRDGFGKPRNFEQDF